MTDTPPDPLAELLREAMLETGVSDFEWIAGWLRQRGVTLDARPSGDEALRAAGDDLYRALSSEHGHGPLGGAPWPACLPVHIAMNRWLAATSGAALAAPVSPSPEETP